MASGNTTNGNFIGLILTSFGNKVISASGISIKDCGVDNSITGGDLVDTSLLPCF